MAAVASSISSHAVTEHDLPSHRADAWLKLFLAGLPSVASALVLLPNGKGGYEIAAQALATGVGVPELLGVGLQAARTDAATVQTRAATSRHTLLAHPFPVGFSAAPAVLVVAAPVADAGLNQALDRHIELALAWWRFAETRSLNPPDSGSSDRFAGILAVLAAFVEQDDAASAYLALVQQLARQLGAERAALGWFAGGRLTLAAVSDQGVLDAAGSNALRGVIDAMEECCDQHDTITYPGRLECRHIDRAHTALAVSQQQAALCSSPLIVDRGIVGAILLARRDGPPFTREEIDWLELCVGMAAPLLLLRRNADRGVIAHLRDGCRRGLTRWIAAERQTPLLLALTAFLGIAGSLLIEGEFHISARAVLEGSTQRAMVAPMRGFVAEAHAKAGDVVEENATLAVLDDRELALERVKWASQQEQVVREYREALAADDRTKVTILAAQLRQAEAEVALIDEQLERARIRAPFAGVIIDGDLSQSLGAPVDPGQLLFKLAPLAGYRIILQVDDRDISQVKVGQSGTLLLSSYADQELPLAIEAITPVANTEDGRNFFRVEARLTQSQSHLLPGMVGVGKIAAGQRSWFWIATHRAADWLRLMVWPWLP